MPFFKSDDIQSWTSGQWFNLDPQNKPEIKGFSNDSRNISPQFAFVALKGERDGCDFAADAVANGATAVIADRELDVEVPVLVVPDALKAFQRIAKMHRLRFENPVVAISGSCGKTSTKELLAKLMSWRNPLVTEKNFNNSIGVPLTLTRIDMRQNQLAIVEAGVSGPGQMQELSDMIEPDISIITNVGLAHMEKFEQIGNIAKEKAILPSSNPNGWCIFHHNLLSWKSFEEMPCKKVVLAQETAPDINADIVFRYSIINLEDCIGLDMSVEGGNEYYFEMPQMSAGMIENTLLSVATALMLGAKEEQIAISLRTLEPLAMRGSVTEIEDSTFYLDCYNASPTSMRDSLARFKEIAPEYAPRIYLLGSMAELGLARHRHHKEVGNHIPYRSGDRAILVGESADVYKIGLLENSWEEESISIIQDLEEIKKILESFKGWVFVKGSRVCMLENAVPQKVLDKLFNKESQQEDSEDAEEISEETENISDCEDITDDSDDYDDSNYQEDDFEEEDSAEDFENLEDEEDEREGI